MKQTEVGRRYRVHVYYTKHLVRSQAISNRMFGFSVIHKGMNKQMAQNVKDVQIDRIRELAKEQGVSMRYLCELVGKKRNFLALVALGKDYVDENELTIIASRLGTTVDYLTGKTAGDYSACGAPTIHDSHAAALLCIGAFIHRGSNQLCCR